ncbi:MAG: dienelactone hydrolase family protein, partial [bacterium]
MSPATTLPEIVIPSPASSATTANLENWRQRALKGFEQLRANPLTGSDRMAAVGFCFGGSTVMQLAYAGADLKGVVSFHCSLPLPSGNEGAMIK